MDIPQRWAQRLYVDGNSARQLLSPASTGSLEAENGEWRVQAPHGPVHGLRQRGTTPPDTVGLETTQEILRALPANIGASELRWTAPPPCTSPAEVLESLAGRFVLRTEDPDSGSLGLRPPQSGAMHAVLAHWSTGSTEPATVVLPTGTGKTETMTALFASERLQRLLILVPSHNLRSQISEVFETYGVLPDIEVLEAHTLGPVVGRIEHHFEDLAAMRSLVDRCNVLVATPSALNASSERIIDALIKRCSHLFVDEAHHVSAKSWSRIRDAFLGKPVVQFTATPYRADGERLGGRVIYSFPLGRAQQLGYFQRISYVSVIALAEPDRVVATEAIARLRADLDRGLDHLIMARVNRISRAREVVQPLYEELAPDLNPQILHSDLNAGERRAAISALNERRSRIIVCVDMLGEGFDFPELKIAALHDPHRSLGVALQFVGRFARSRSDLGTATAVVARPDPGYDPRLRALYAERNQWDLVIDALSSQAVGEVQELDEFEMGFQQEGDDELSVHVLRPKMSTVVYRTDCAEWEPEKLSELFEPEDIVVAPTVNASEHVVWTVIESRSAVRWADLRSVEDLAHHLHLLHWDRERGLLYINSSDLDSLHEDLAHEVCGKSVARITGDVVYRVLGDINRPVPTNVGLLSLRNRSRRFTMHVGADVYEGFPVADQQTRTNTNIFVYGFSYGDRVTLGAARKGRIWSQQAAKSILHWVRWARRLGPKLLDDSMPLDELFRSFVRPKPLESRPALIPLAIDWPWLAFAGMGDGVSLEVSGTTALLIDVELALVEQEEEGPIRYLVSAEALELEYEATVQDGQLVHRALGAEAQVLRERSASEPLSEYLTREGTTIWFEAEVLIEGPDLLFELEREQIPIDLEQLHELEWTGVDITRESQGPRRDPATVQAFAATRLVELRDWDVVIDDDETGEIADLVALKEDPDRFVVHLVHCKYSSESSVGARVADLYEVCGQAHRSAHHRQDVAAMVKNLIRRERNRRGKGRSGLMVGTDEDLLKLQDSVRLRRPEMHVSIAQPGFSKGAAAARHLQLLGAADLYVKEIANGSFDVWCSE